MKSHAELVAEVEQLRAEVDDLWSTVEAQREATAALAGQLASVGAALAETRPEPERKGFLHRLFGATT